MAAGLEGDVGRGAASTATGVCESLYLGVRSTGLAMMAAPHRAPRPYQDATDGGIRRRLAKTLPCLLARNLHPALIDIHWEPLRPRSFTSVSSALMNSSMSRNDL